jgi:hypothetical protein
MLAARRPDPVKRTALVLDRSLSIDGRAERSALPIGLAPGLASAEQPSMPSCGVWPKARPATVPGAAAYARPS